MNAPTGPGQQLPLKLRYPPDQRFETFVATDPSALPMLRALPANQSPNLLFIAGAEGTGKTHLAIAACAHAEENGFTAGYLPLASAAGRVRDALDGLHQLDLIALDGLDRIAGARDDEIALFDFHNRAHDAGRSVLYTARAWPDALPLTLPDLQSRLSQCARVALAPLDDAARGELLRLRAWRRGLELDDAAIGWLLQRVQRDLSSLTALLDRLDHASLAAQRRITVPFLRQVLASTDDNL